MIDFGESIVRSIVFHSISSQEKKCYLSNELFDYETEDEEEFLKKNFLKPFTSNRTTYEFVHAIDLELNPLFKISTDVFYDSGDFIDNSKKIYQHLKSVSKHPKIKDGDLFIVKFEDIKVDNKYCDALGIYKIESKDTFFDVDKDHNISLKKGIGLKKYDKAALIIFTDKPYTLFVIDSPSNDTDYWSKDFINASYRNDNINSTNHLLSLTKSYITAQLPKEEVEFSSTDQIDLLNRSVNYFQSNSNFIKSNFEEQVLRSEDIITSFRNFENNYVISKKIDILDNFEIAQPIVRKYSKTFKKVLKLDKSIDIYIHGDQNIIEKGVDSNSGKKFYKIYYDVEL